MKYNKGTLTLGSVGPETLSGTLTNAGTITDLNTPNQGFSQGLLLASNGTLNNQATGLFDIQTDSYVEGTVFAGTGTINNSGTIRKSAGTGTTTVQVALNNAAGGILEADTGTLTLRDGGSTSTGGTFNAKQNATLVLNTDATLTGTYSGSGAGTVQLAAGNVQVATGADTTFKFPAGLFVWSGGTLAAGTGNFTNTGFITLNGGLQTLTGALTNAGTITDLTDPNTSSAGLALAGGATLNNLATGLVDFQTDLGVSPTEFGGAGVINNSGTIRKSAGTGTTPISIPLNNAAAGILEVDTGTLTLPGGGSSAGGTFIARQNATLALDPNSGLGSSATFNGTYTGSGAGTVQVTGNTVQVATGADTTFNFPAGLFSWGGGTFAVGTGNFTNAGSITLSSVNAAPETLSGTLSNAGTITDNNTPNGGFSQGFLLAGNGTLDNLATGLFDFQTDSYLEGTVYAGTGVFNNAGIIRKSAGSTNAASSVEVALNNVPGSILEVDAGVLELLGGGTSTGGIFIARSNATLVLNNSNGVTATFNGAYTGSGGGSVQLAGGTVQVANGADTTFNFPTGLFNWTGGTLAAGTGNFTNTGFITLSGGTAFRLGSNETLTGTLANAGTITDLNDTSLGQSFQLSGGTLNNLDGGLLDFQTDTNVAGTGALNNAGTLRKSAGSLTTLVYSVTLNNTGTVEAASGTFQFNDPITQVSGTTLSGGTWLVDAGATLDLFSAPGLTTNKANVTLNGVGSGFRQFSALANNAGSFSVANSADFLTNGNLTNSGNLTLIGNAAIAVIGTYTQTAAGTLNVQVGGPPASGQYGRLGVTGQATLAGTLAIALVNGFGPTTGQTYPIVTYAGHTGDFATVTGLGDGRRTFFSETTNPTGVVLNAVLSSADLSVSHIDPLPATATVGQNVTIHYTVQNLSATPATGSWVDSVYLSADGTLNPNGILLGRLTHTGDVAGNGSYDGTLTASLPLVVGNVHVIVVADSRGLVPDTNRANNVLPSTDVLNVTAPVLALGSAFSGTIVNGQDLLYRIDVPAGSGDLVLSADFAVGSEADLFLSFAALPSNTSADASFANQPALNAQLVISNPQAGSFYLLVHGSDGASTPQTFTLTPRLAAFEIRGISPNHGSNAGQTTVTVAGSGFTAASLVSLVSGGTTRNATTVLFKDSNTLFATFDLTGLTVGTFDVKVVDGTHSATAAGAFTVDAGNPGQIDYQLDVPSFIRVGALGEAVVTYQNTGGTDVPAPLMLLSSDNAEFRLSATDPWQTGSIQLFGYNPNGPAGNLPPGASGSIEVQFLPITQAGDIASNFTLNTGDPTETIDWASLKASLQPVGFPSSGWDALYANFESLVGSTVGSYQSALDAAATYLSQQGEYTPDLTLLRSYVFQVADNFGAISQQNTLGQFGWGNFGPNDTNVQSTPDGIVVISSGNLTRDFYPQLNSDGSVSYHGAPGDPATALLNASANTFVVREADGSTETYAVTIAAGAVSSGRLSTTQDANGNTVTYTANGSSDSFGDTTTYATDAQGDLIVTDAEGRVTTFAFDAYKNLVSVTNAAGTTRLTYVSGQAAATNHDVQSIAFSNGTHEYFVYDGLGRVTQTTFDNNATPVAYSYGPMGQVTITDATGAKIVLSANESGQLAQVQDPLGQIESGVFDANHNVIQVDGPQGTKDTTGYDSLNNPTSITDPLGSTIGLTFNATTDALSSLTDANSVKTSYSSDSHGNITTVTYADGSTQQYQYDSVGNLIESIDQLGQATTYTYNSHNLRTGVAYADGSTIAYTYDAHRNLATATDASGVTTFTYDLADRLTKVMYPNGTSVAYAYNALGERTQMAASDGPTVNYAYDALDRLTGLTDGGGNPIVSYTYNATGQIAQENMGNGTSTTYTYDAVGNVTSVINYGPGAAVISSFVYVYNARGLPVSVTTLGGTTTYGYDADGQLTSVNLPSGETIAYQYDAAGNRIAVTVNGVTTDYTTTNLNEYTAVGTTSYTYNADGQVASMTNAAGTTNYRYNAAGQLVSVIAPSDTFTYQYDALGDLLSATHNGQVTTNLVDPTGLGNVIAQYTDGTRTASYTYGLGLTSQVSASGAAYYAFDAVGNTADLTGQNGTVLNSYSYLPFGESLSSSGVTACRGKAGRAFTPTRRSET